MTTATLSLATPGRVKFRCDDLRIYETRDLEADPPFEDWSRAYATGYWNEDALLGIGLAIGRWFDGRQQWLARLIQATPPILLTIETTAHPEPVEKAALDAPWELIAGSGRGPGPAVGGAAAGAGTAYPDALSRLLAQVDPVDLRNGRHLALDPGLQLATVRRLGPAALNPPAPSPYRLSVVFMAAQPDGVANLQVDVEEVAIYRSAKGIGMDLVVEDSGTLNGLISMAARVGDCDVIHMSCHGAMGNNPVLVLETEKGERVDVTAADLSNGFGNKPRLMFLSACSTAGAALGPEPDAGTRSNATAAELGTSMLWPLVGDLCRRGWPAVLGWSCAVMDLAAIETAAALYRQLVQGVTLVEALAKTRAIVADTPSGAAWHKARLFLGPTGGDKIIGDSRPRPGRADILQSQSFLDPATRKIAVASPDQPFPYRRAFQRVLVALREGSDSGVVIHGDDMAARATFTARVLRRTDRDLKRVVVAGDFDAAAILQQIRDQTAIGEVNAIASPYLRTLNNDPGQLRQALRPILEGPCQSAGSGAFALVLHGFDPIANPNAPPDELRSLAPDLLVVARALIGGFTGAATASRLLFTSAAPFSVPAEDGRELAAALHVERLVRP